MKEVLEVKICGIAVRTAELLYCLNDLHKAAGGEKRHQPSDWLRTQSACELVELLDSRGSPSLMVSTGRNGGTYACKELVYAYAMWVSAKFYLNVICAYDALVTGDLQKAVDIVRSQAMQALEIPSYLPDMYVYAIQNTMTGNVKLGISQHPEERLRQLQVGCDGELVLLGYKHAANRFSDESALHKLNSDKHMRGEWFSHDVGWQDVTPEQLAA